MDSKLFTSAALGRLVEIQLPNQKVAFLPEQLTNSWAMDGSLWPSLMAARETIARLDGIGRHLPAYQLILTPLQQREALRSSSMEGTYATPEQLLLYQAEPRAPTSANDPANDWREVYNYGNALRMGTQLLDNDAPLSLHLIRTLHKQLLSGVRGRHKRPGEFRTTHVIVGHSGRFIPPPPHSLVDCLDQLEASLRTEPTVDPLIWAFMIHYQFEAIHPFLDGNGRVGRLLLSLQIYRSLKLACPWLYMSAFFERHKDEYIDLLFRVSTHGDWLSWINFCLKGAQVQAEDSINRIEKLVKLREEFNAVIAKLSGASARLYTVIDKLFESPLITIPRVQQLCKVTYPTAAAAIEKLVKRKILTPGPASARPRYYYSEKIFSAAYADS